MKYTFLYIIMNIYISRERERGEREGVPGNYHWITLNVQNLYIPFISLMKHTRNMFTFALYHSCFS